MTILTTMRTADRSKGDTRNSMPKGRKNYLGRTVRSLVSSGVRAEEIHLCFTEPDDSWADGELQGLAVTRHVPHERRTPNRNALAQVSVLDEHPAEWILMLEDDLEVCSDFLGSVTRWLKAHVSERVRVYRLFSFRQPLQTFEHAYHYPLKEMVGSQAVLMRAEDARAMVAWHDANPRTWRPLRAPHQHEYSRGFDKMVGYWALSADKTQPYALVSRPFMVKHIGEQSSLRVSTWGLQNNGKFSPDPWGSLHMERVS